jgi:hypothetical protein
MVRLKDSMGEMGIEGFPEEAGPDDEQAAETWCRSWGQLQTWLLLY